MMVLLQLRTRFEAIRTPGKSGPGGLRVLGSRASAARLHQKHRRQSKTLCFHKPVTGLTRRGFCETGVFGASPVASALDRHTGRDPSRPSPTLSCRLQSYTRGAEFFCKLYVRSCRIRWSAGKTTVEHRKCVPPRPQSRGCCRSTEFVIVVPRPSLAQYFSPKTCHQQKAEMRKSIGQQST